ncbi:MAG: hypothetical protein U0350_31425 [Caldilineaceae bacterium]
MRKWFVRDRDGHEIYLTAEQWQHIVSGHNELRNHREDVLNTVRRGKRQQKPLDPKAYVYRLVCDTLRPPFNGILVLVTFHVEQDENDMAMTNNFIVTAWGIMMRR